jgi:hypothetical protein
MGGILQVMPGRMAAHRCDTDPVRPEATMRTSLPNGRRSSTSSKSAGSTKRPSRCKPAAAKPATTGPSLALDRYAGAYTDPWYGTIKVRQSGKGLAIDFPHSTGMEGPLTHYQ